MTLLELSVEYRDHARALDFRIVQLRDAWEHTMDGGGAMHAGRADQGAVHHAAGGPGTGSAL